MCWIQVGDGPSAMKCRTSRWVITGGAPGRLKSRLMMCLTDLL